MPITVKKLKFSTLDPDGALAAITPTPKQANDAKWAAAHPLTPVVQKTLDDIIAVYTTEQTALIEELDRVYSLVDALVKSAEGLVRWKEGESKADLIKKLGEARDDAAAAHSGISDCSADLYAKHAAMRGNLKFPDALATALGARVVKRQMDDYNQKRKKMVDAFASRKDKTDALKKFPNQIDSFLKLIEKEAYGSVDEDDLDKLLDEVLKLVAVHLPTDFMTEFVDDFKAGKVDAKRVESETSRAKGYVARRKLLHDNAQSALKIFTNFRKAVGSSENIPKRLVAKADEAAIGVKKILNDDKDIEELFRSYLGTLKEAAAQHTAG